ncbi:pyrroloquinoline quinone biosynthesis protein PqqB [Ruegeria marina]|uniref:Coenzyme PQQ synthesis protein B n=1 Tax=Ruegeria marina TaxID=639004 RepID=A0A1G6SPJ7_9RHOB|nr:pyrroloquinoline quinone biosynthesis protein PqqB [Ruegeria marina]SDD18810.1 pyrroloquinoline quinone biosynthesis protein B [Ruegeria marina]
MRILVLGAAAGGGLPQWNCGCVNCVDARAGRLKPSGQSSLAVSADGRQWSILNASPDIRQQLQDSPALHPRGLRGSPIASVLVTNGDIDHIAGLLSLREQTPFVLCATREIHAVLDGNRIFDAVSREKVRRHPVALDQPFDLHDGLEAMLFAVPGKVPLFMEGDVVDTSLVGEQTVGVRLSDGRAVVYYIPGCAHVPDDLLARLGDADHLLFDGTLWDDDEMIRSGTGTKTGRRMGHISISGPDGSIARLAGVEAGKTFIHINNTNPVWRPDRPERAHVLAQGWQVAEDGLEIVT